ncbi:aminoglycoside phosphotransferase family protein [Solwaraspora sp. WMMB335]|uniref:aminoglycoside phosphotransferase family protein n=1 Tax=Solwaraspora sp. WMMB335 TaxID=3404118 RepID=UPI003B93BB69
MSDLIARYADRWSLRTGAPLPGGYVSVVVAARCVDGTDAVLKLQPPGDRESELEAAALACWNGQAAVRLLAHDPVGRALLIERCRPGDPVASLAPEAALDVYVDLLPRLWRPVTGPFTPLTREARRWATNIPKRWEQAGRPFERRLVDAAVDLLTGLAASQPQTQVLLHQDLHAGNVLRAQREPWLVIDPKPLVGERAFGLAPVVRGVELGHSRALVRRRLDRLSAELGVDRQRACGWTIGQSLAWAFTDGPPLTAHLDVVRWLLSELSDR